MSEGTKRRLAAIVSADVVGYSRLMQEDEVGTHARLKARFQELVAPSIERYGGRVFKLMGDGLLAEFPSVVAASDWAVDVQSAVAKANADDPPEQRIEYRVGVNLGDIIVDGDDLYGDGVNLAARVQEIANTGGVCLSDDAYHHARGKVSAPFADGGEVSLKNIDRPVRVWHWAPEDAGATTRRAAEPALAVPDKPSIAVLPFDNMSGDPEQEYFADGVVEDIITRLSRYPWLSVIARNSSFTYKGQPADVKQVGRDLGVRYVLEGSIRRAGRRIRITGQLIDVRSGNHLWAERFEGEDADLFDLQDEMTLRIVSSIRPELILAEAQRSSSKPSQNLDSWESTNRGIALYWRWTRSDLQEAEKLARNATTLDLQNAEAHALLATVLWSQAISGFATDGRNNVAEALEVAKRAVALDARSARAHSALGVILMSHLRYDEAIAETDRALELLPGSADALSWSGIVLAYAGPQTLAIERLTESIRLNPRDPMIYGSHQALAIAQFALGRYQDALNATTRVERILPEWIGARTIHIASLAELGRLDEARAVTGESRKINPRFTVKYAVIRHPYRDQQVQNRLASALRKAGLD